MRTEDLIAALAAAPSPAPARGLTLRLVAAVAFGGLAGLGLVAVWFGFEGLPALASTPTFWIRLALLAVFGAVLVRLVEGAARPGARTSPWPLAAILTAALVLAIAQLALSPVGRWPALVLGATWSDCVWRVAALALCTLPPALLAVRSGAPTRPRFAGAAAGALSGAAGAVLYALVCREPGLPFVVIWYGAGVALTTLLGALLGPAVLRWRDRGFA